MQNSYRARLNFNPRSPQGGATIAGGLADLTRELFQSTLPARGSDAEQRERFKAMRIISIHAPRKGERRPKAVPWSRSLNFNPRSPRGGATRAELLLHRGRHCGISIHAPHEGERRAVATVAEAAKKYFNPRSPRGGATCLQGRGGSDKSYISIHAPHEGERQPRRP